LIIIRLLRSYDAFILLSIPFFVLAGRIMTEAQISDKLIKLSDLLVGRFKGGLGHINVVVSMFFGGCTGTAISDTSAIGSIMIPSMVKENYPKDFSAAVTAASSTMGPIIPPSLMFILYGSIAQVSIRDLFIAGAIPGIMIGLFQMVVVAGKAHKNNYPRRDKKIPAKEALTIIREASWALMLPFIIMGGIISGLVSPTEAAVIAVFYVIFIALFIYRTMNINKILIIIKDSAVETGAISILLAAASIFGWVLANEQVPQNLAGFLMNSTAAKWQILLIINMIFLIVGMFMDSIPAVLILAPVFMSVFKVIGVDPLHAGIFMCVNLITGLATPPVGCCLFAASTISREPFERVSKAVMPFVFANLTVTLIVTYIPAISLFLPGFFK
jgi:tripartite ATP-independent transporter DctM subunit